MPARTAGAILTAAALTLGGLFAGVSPAAASGGGIAALKVAAPHCDEWKHGFSGSAKCTGLTSGSEFRVVVLCGYPNGNTFYTRGLWKNSGGTSTATCHPNGASIPITVATQMRP
ncbi:hypothetical protein [Streptomyces sp. NPDC020965]|uniref:hypothetical protein n=1 Tax=Streptomyces sp. NPDC020965 TaxID=3365105 RepID=UPI00378D4DB3